MSKDFTFLTKSNVGTKGTVSEVHNFLESKKSAVIRLRYQVFSLKLKPNYKDIKRFKKNAKANAVGLFSYSTPHTDFRMR